MSEEQMPGEPMPGEHMLEAQVEGEEEETAERFMMEALMTALMSTEQMNEVPMEDAQTTEESTTEAQVEEPRMPEEQMVEVPLDEEPTTEESMGEESMGEEPTTEGLTTGESVEEESMEEDPMEEALGTRRQLSGRPSRWQHSTATQSRLQRALHTYRLESQIEEYALNREEIQEFAPPETRRFLRGARPAPPMDAVAQAEEHANGEEPDSAKVNALFVPQNRLQVARFNESIRMRDFYETATREEMISITLPTAYETWKMEKEYSDLKGALKVSLQTMEEDELEKNHRARLWSGSRRNRLHLFRSRGYGSSFGEVISADEDWPEEDWASAGLEQPDAPFLVRFEAKMRTRPVLVPDKTTETR